MCQLLSFLVRFPLDLYFQSNKISARCLFNILDLDFSWKQHLSNHSKNWLWCWRAFSRESASVGATSGCWNVRLMSNTLEQTSLYQFVDTDWRGWTVYSQHTDCSSSVWFSLNSGHEVCCLNPETSLNPSPSLCVCRMITSWPWMNFTENMELTCLG